MQHCRGNLERLNANGIIAKAECVKKKLELLNKKQKLEETRIRNYVMGYKLRVLELQGEGQEWYWTSIPKNNLSFG